MSPRVSFRCATSRQSPRCNSPVAPATSVTSPDRSSRRLLSVCPAADDSVRYNEYHAFHTGNTINQPHDDSEPPLPLSPPVAVVAVEGCPSRHCARSPVAVPMSPSHDDAELHHAVAVSPTSPRPLSRTGAVSAVSDRRRVWRRLGLRRRQQPGQQANQAIALALAQQDADSEVPLVRQTALRPSEPRNHDLEDSSTQLLSQHAVDSGYGPAAWARIV